MKILGIDPGIHGGLAIVMINDSAAPQLVDVIDIPVPGAGAETAVVISLDAALRQLEQWQLLRGRHES
jgi:hypothetical protein